MQDLSLSASGKGIHSLAQDTLRGHALKPQCLGGLTSGRASYLIKRPRTDGLIKKIAHAYKYFFTKPGRRVVVTALLIRKYFVRPTLVRNAL